MAQKLIITLTIPDNENDNFDSSHDAGFEKYVEQVLERGEFAVTPGTGINVKYVRDVK